MNRTIIWTVSSTKYCVMHGGCGLPNVKSWKMPSFPFIAHALNITLSKHHLASDLMALCALKRIDIKKEIK